MGAAITDDQLKELVDEYEEKERTAPTSSKMDSDEDILSRLLNVAVSNGWIEKSEPYKNPFA